MDPYIIEFPKIGDPGQGYISFAQSTNLPFEIKRVYWTFYTPDDVLRGRHAHFQLEQVLIAVSGKISITLIATEGKKEEFVLDSPHKGLYIPKLIWGTMKYSHDAVQLCLANMPYEEMDYIRDYEEFLKLT